ncbi:hypothetical protein JTE90_015307 [Oedothorax gibbosus]|uniref:Uncharacterized protein n=1 Tax=Oedothorax gibbosus TaxID=931172 RepID=A0AAV6VNC2_9ARAC|nr:hypothetical protein JTE90_015307 [Oedothorax gibbosus]
MHSKSSMGRQDPFAVLHSPSRDGVSEASCFSDFFPAIFRFKFLLPFAMADQQPSTSGTSSRGEPTRQSPRTAPRPTTAARPRNVAKRGSGPASRTNRPPATSPTTAATAAAATAEPSRPVAVGVAGPSRQQPARGRQICPHCKKRKPLPRKPIKINVKLKRLNWDRILSNPYVR